MGSALVAKQAVFSLSTPPSFRPLVSVFYPTFLLLLASLLRVIRLFEESSNFYKTSGLLLICFCSFLQLMLRSFADKATYLSVIYECKATILQNVENKATEMDLVVGSLEVSKSSAEVWRGFPLSTLRLCLSSRFLYFLRGLLQESLPNLFLFCLFQSSCFALRFHDSSNLAPKYSSILRRHYH